MMMWCDDYGPFDFRNSCVRLSWTAIVSAGFVILLLLTRISIPVPERAKPWLEPVKSQFIPFLTLPEAEALDARAAGDEKLGPLEDVAPRDDPSVAIPLWRSLILSWLGLLQTLVWLGVGSYTSIVQPSHPWLALCPVLISSSWLYATVRPIFHPKATPPMDLFSLYCIHLVFAMLLFGGIFYERNVLGVPLPPPLVVVGHIFNLVIILALTVVVLWMPMGIPSNRVRKDDIGLSVSPEDYTTLVEWITFSWVLPLIRRGTNTTLNEGDVWDLSPTMQSRPVFIKFNTLFQSTLFRKIWAANSFDMLIDVSLTVVSIIFSYMGPFFLKRILDAIEESTPESRSRAYIYAFLACLTTLAKAQADVQHLWFSRRAATRVRSELMASIYDKALKRKDFSGIIDKEKQQEAPESKATSKRPATAADKAKAKEKEAKKDDPRAGADVGKIVNLMAGDAGRIAMTFAAVYALYGAPLEIIIGVAFLYQILGFSAFAGFFVLVIGWPLNTYLTRRSIRIQKGLLAARDKRMGVVSELIGAVKFIKFFAWESRWIDRALDAREVEMKWLIKSRINSILWALTWTFAPILVSVVCFLVYTLQGNKLTPSVAFTAIALFNMIRIPLNIIPTYVVYFLQTRVALNRIVVYLDEEEVSPQVSVLKKFASDSPADEDSGLGIESGTFKWNEVVEAKEDKDKTNTNTPATEETTILVEGPDESPLDADHKFELKDISVMFPEGELTIIAGPTASGKTALLMSLLGEMTLVQGQIIMSKNPSKVDEHGLTHTISYAAQTPWLRHQSIKDNILFGYPYDEERYNAVIECCALTPDLDIFEDGDATEIGARGVNLSGGQKARVALARAVYAPTKYVLLDDPLSAVDSHTARFLFDRLICGPLLTARTVILVTHHVELVLPAAYYLVRMLDGRIDTQGTVKDLRTLGALDEIARDAITEVEAKKGSESPQSQESDSGTKVVDPNKQPRKLVQDEHRETGRVKWHIYKTYLKASSYWIWGFLAFIIVINQFLGVLEKAWIKTWGDAYKDTPSLARYSFKSLATSEHVSIDGLSFPHHFQIVFSPQSLITFTWPNVNEHPLFYVAVYSLIGLVGGVVSICSSAAQFTGALRASRQLFHQLLVGVVRATMRWHDTTPQGRLLNRFGKDIETIDSTLASSLQAVNASLATFLAAILTVCYVFPVFFFPAVVIGYLYWILALGYLNTGRDIRRMESNTRSPIFSGFTELLEGIVTVRAFSAEKRLLDDLHTKIDITTKMWYTYWMTNRWLLLNFDALGAVSVFVTTLLALSGLVSAGWAGFCITSAMAFTTSVYWTCRHWTALELDLNSVERVVEYLNLPQEPPAIIESNRPPAYWPSSSNKDALIDVNNLVVKYAPELPAVLHGISFRLKAGERVGLLGRTGSGKSTLAMSLMRFVDPEEGRILIDGIDISTIGVHDLRSRLTFIPQDATLFSGKLRENLDPFNEHEDSECLDVLRRVHMLNDSAHTSRHPSRPDSRAASIHGVERDTSSIMTGTDVDAKTVVSLDTQVSAGGANFSQGQRQLIALARALLRRSPIIILDEATSSIDFATDAKIQTTIREEFTESLLVTIAHRLRTVIDYDRLIVLDKGRIVEFDTPLNLIRKEDGYFRNMCLKSGTFAELEVAAVAKAAGGEQKVI